ncbi:hypothetical protein BH11PSE3_BH11PSE3_50370 [soil metagenome]
MVFDHAPISRRRIYWVGALAVVAACLAMIFMPGLMLRLEADFVTSRGEWRQVRLADGSTVDLAPLSAISVALAATRREVRLVTGQAFFEVTPDLSRPFLVEASGLRVTVLGTAFGVRQTPESVGVTVKQGLVRVELASPAAARILQAGDWTTVSPTGQVAIGRDPTEDIAVWRQGRLVARDRPMAQVVEDLRPYFNGMIVFAGDATARRRVTGDYPLRDPLEALRSMARAYPDIAVTRLLPWLVIVSGG